MSVQTLTLPVNFELYKAQCSLICVFFESGTVRGDGVFVGRWEKGCSLTWLCEGYCVVFMAFGGKTEHSVIRKFKFISVTNYE